MGNQSKVKKKVDEGWFRNAAIASAIGAASMLGGVKANAQNVVPQSNDTVQVTKNGGIGLGNTLRNKGYSENDVQQTAKTFNPSNIMMRNAKGGVNSEISNFLSSLNNVSSSMSTDSIKVFNGAEAKKRMKYLGSFNENNAKKYKLFFDANENAFLMPINYTLNDVQKELGTFQLGDFDIQ